jgi:uncharacterized protein (UPF0335 family)
MTMEDGNHGGNNSQQCSDINTIKGQLPDMLRRLDRLEDKQQDHDKSIKELFTAQEGTKIYVKQILDEIAALKNQLFTFLTDFSKQSGKERTDNLSKWMDYSKFILQTTFYLVLVYYLSKKGVVIPNGH